MLMFDDVVLLELCILYLQFSEGNVFNVSVNF